MSIDELMNYAQSLLVTWAPKVLGAVVGLIIGLWIIGKVTKLIAAGLEKRGMDVSLRRFLSSMVGIILKLALALTILDLVGIPATSFVAILGAAGLAIGMALSGTLSNFAGGVMLMIFKPFKAGDWIDAQGFSGTVYEVGIFNTILKTPDNKTVIIPNAPLSSGAMVNYSVEPQRRVDFVFGIGYGDDIDKAKGIIQSLLDADQRVLKGGDRDYFIAVSELADSSVNLVVRAWVDSANYWGVFFDTTENVKKEFDAQSISIPYPQMDVHVNQQ